MNANLSELYSMQGELCHIPEPKLKGNLPSPRGKSRRIWRIFEESEEARYPVLRVAPDGTLVHANKIGRELVERLGYGIGQRLPDQLCGLFPEVLDSGQSEDIEVRTDDESFVFTLMPRPLLREERQGHRNRSSDGGTEAEHDPQTLLDSLPILFYMVDPNGIPANNWVSPAIRAVTGFSKEEYLSDPGFWESRVHPEDFWRVIRAFRTVGAKGGVSVEYRWRRADGKYRWYLDQAVLVNGHKGTARQLAGARIDTTARHDAEERMRQGNEFMEALIGAVSDGVFLVNENSNYIYMNEPFERLIGLRREQWARGNTNISVHPDDQQRLASAVLRATDGRKCGCRARFRTASGAYVEVGLSMSPFSWKGRQMALASVNCINQQT